MLICRQPIERSKQDGGFTLIELLVVLSIIGLLGVVLAGRFAHRPDHIARLHVAAVLRQKINKAEKDAKSQGTVQSVDTRAYAAGMVTTFSPTIGTARALILFPDGSSNGGTVQLDHRPLLTIDWLTSEAHDVG